MLIDDRTIESKRHVRVVQVGEHPLDVTIAVDGERAEPATHYWCDIKRDGGSRWWKTTLGDVRLPASLRDRDKPEHLRQPPTLDGEPIGRAFPPADERVIGQVKALARAESGGRVNESELDRLARRAFSPPPKWTAARALANGDTAPTPSTRALVALFRRRGWRW